MQQGKESSAPLMRERENEEVLSQLPLVLPSTKISGVNASEAIHVQENKRRKRRIMKVAVYLMFGLIVVGVFSVWLFHKDSNESVSMGSRFKFTVKARTLEIQNAAGDGVLYADLGMHLKATPYEQCWNDEINEYEINCIDWRKMAEVHFHKNEVVTNSCYSIDWTALSEEFEAEDCFYIQTYNWFGFLSDGHSTWPMKDIQLRNMSFYPKYPNKLDRNLVPYWLSSAGVSIVINNNTPFSVSWNISAQRQLCVAATKSYKAISAKPVLRYTICQGEDMQQAYYRTKEFLEEFLAKTPLNTKMNDIIPHPIYYVTDESGLDTIKEKIASNSKCSYLELFSDWESQYGDLVFKPEVFTKLKNLQTSLSVDHCKYMVPISAFFAFKSKNFEIGIANKYFVRDEMNLATELMNWDGHEGAVLDITNQNATSWYIKQLSNLLNQLDIGAFKLLHVDIPSLISFQNTNASVLDYPKFFAKMVAKLNVTMVIENVAGFMLNEAHVVVHTNMNFTQESRCFDKVVPETLMLGLESYSLIIADIGKLIDFDITEELLTRWLQIVIFYPGYRLPFFPVMSDQVMNRRVETLMRLRNQVVIPYLQELRENQESDPLIRPLWWPEPEDDVAQVINDQFLVGDKILVTPILCEGVNYRNVYLPRGNWQAGHSGIVSEGKSWIQVHYDNLDQVPYFTLVED
ncbi:myogenesis-regulating glycosidase isoform X1 [Patella vulgata]|uniref:myogenesis-regulating glycosidase isoform X1 n=1 Tax=Patella vulgata TaxID=6465 RepID=UPI0021802372|nr:myogenesis-regulating glycosidase isoform X1 [Patella vulgata]